MSCCQSSSFDCDKYGISTVESLLGSSPDIATIFSALSQKDISLIGCDQFPPLSVTRLHYTSDSRTGKPAKIACESKLPLILHCPILICIYFQYLIA